MLAGERAEVELRRGCHRDSGENEFLVDLLAFLHSLLDCDGLRVRQVEERVLLAGEREQGELVLPVDEIDIVDVDLVELEYVLDALDAVVSHLVPPSQGKEGYVRVEILVEQVNGVLDLLVAHRQNGALGVRDVVGRVALELILEKVEAVRDLQLVQVQQEVRPHH